MQFAFNQNTHQLIVILSISLTIDLTRAASQIAVGIHILVLHP
jgi:hypothetical protein